MTVTWNVLFHSSKATQNSTSYKLKPKVFQLIKVGVLVYVFCPSLVSIIRLFIISDFFCQLVKQLNTCLTGH